jgi:transcriptional regulator with XRE-family HTH domain
VLARHWRASLGPNCPEARGRSPELDPSFIKQRRDRAPQIGLAAVKVVLRAHETSSAGHAIGTCDIVSSYISQGVLSMPTHAPCENRPYNPGVRMPPNAMAQRRGIATEEGSAEIGERIARLRKERGITQVEMADRLGLSQPVVSDYERGSLRVHGELIAMLAKILRVSADEILGLEKTSTPRGPRDSAIARRLRDIDKLSKRDRDALARTIDAFLTRAKPQ